MSDSSDPVYKLMRRVADIVEQYRVDLSDEKKTQAELAMIFESQGLIADREHRLSAKDIPDFFIDGVVVEVKIKGQRASFSRQLDRYAHYEKVKGIVLVTGKSILLPRVINGKPLMVASLSRAWL